MRRGDDSLTKIPKTAVRRNSESTDRGGDTDMRFKSGDIVYWCQRTGNRFEVNWGMVSEQYSDAVCVDYLSVKERRRVNGIPINEFQSEDRYKKLPKGWNYGTKLFEITLDDIENDILDIKNPKSIKEAFEKGLLVKKETIFHGEIYTDITKNGYRIAKKYPMFLPIISSTSIRPGKVYCTYREAEEEVKEHIKKFIRQSNLSDYDWSVEQIDKTLGMWQYMTGETDELRKEYRDWLLAMDNVDDIELRLSGGQIQWKYWKNKRWNNISLN